MKHSIGRMLSKSIKENKWVQIKYRNKNEEETLFWCAVHDIMLNSRKIKVSIFNQFKGQNILHSVIDFNHILSCEIIEGTYYEVDEKLVDKIEKNLDLLTWLEYDNFNDKILEYYSEAKRLDNDPYQSLYGNVEGIDAKVLLKSKFIKLTSQQFKKIVNDICQNLYDENKKFSILAINRLSICESNKQYIVAYNPLVLDVEQRSLKINENMIINSSFLIDGMKKSLATYLDISPNDFIYGLKHDFDTSKELLRDNLRLSEKIDENPYIMLIQRDIVMDYDKIYESIIEKHKLGKLELPMKAFFGEISKRNRGKTEPTIVLIDKKVDIDQIRVVYNAMKHPVTYVQGPPGTGKTTTLLNVILSSFFREETCLICSNNNQPLDDIVQKIKFKYKEKDVIFPLIRLGNRSELLKATEYIKILVNNKNTVNIFENKLKELVTLTTANYEELKNLLIKYETKLEIKDNLNDLNRFYSYIIHNNASSKVLLGKIEASIEKLKKKDDTIKPISNEDVVSKVKSATDDLEFMMYLYYNSFKYINRLFQTQNEDLLQVIRIENEEQRVNEFIKYLKDGKSFRKFQKIFPVIVCTNISCLRLGDTNALFDICIMDEAGQCDVASALVPISKARRLLLVGDVNQLQPVITLDSTINENMMKKYEVPREYSYLNNSIIQLMSTVDDISSKILLSYHYRCGKKIADFSNMRYYDKRLKIKTTLNDEQLHVISVQNSSYALEKNSYLPEAKAIIDYILHNQLDEKDVTIVTPFRNQALLINELLKQNQLKIKCGTIHTVQGAENKIIIFAPGIGLKTSKKTYEWVANNKELINVAVTRAKDRLVIVSDEEALNALANKDKEDDIISLYQYAKMNGSFEVAKSSVNKIEIGLSNGSECEKELFSTLTQFCSVYKRYSIKRNQPVRKVLPKVEDESLKKYFEKSEFDLVLFSKNIFGNLIPRVVIELNGGEHYVSYSRTLQNDKKKISICQENNIKYLSIPNSYSKSYETISNLIIKMNGESDEDYNLFNMDL